jgi:hypothetical protein
MGNEMVKRNTPFSQLTIGSKEAAEFLGFSSIPRFLNKVKLGLIPGCKPGKEWVFLKEDLIQYIHAQQTRIALCQSLSARTKNIMKLDLRSPGSSTENAKVSECMNLRKQLKNQKLNAMKNKEKKS